jgi:hypothetical protein
MLPPHWTPFIGEGAIARLLAPSLSGSATSDVLSRADKILNHEFDLLGSGPMRIHRQIQCPGFEGHSFASTAAVRINSANAAEAARIRQLLPAGYDPIDWQRDCRSGYRWSEGTWSQFIPIGHLPGVDVKVPWELGRLQHLPWLAMAYAIAKRSDKYAAEFRCQVLDFLAHNPPRWGVQWRCTMDVAIRAANLVAAYDLFRHFGATFDAEFAQLFRRSLEEHAIHIWNHREWHPLHRNNHYLCDMVGLLYAAAYLPATRAGKEWLRWSVCELGRELAFQFERDGGNFEASTFYHRLSAEAVLHGVALVRQLPSQYSQLLPEWHAKVVEQIEKFTAVTTVSAEEICRVGDNDSGRFFVMPRGAPFSNLAPTPPAVDPLAGLELHAFPLFGLYVYRSQRMHISIRCGSLGQNGQGGHAHNDELSFELALGGLPFIVDPGTFVYTPSPELRNRYRSTAMHNTLTIDGCEQNPWPSGQRGLFRMHDRCRAQVLALSKTRFVGVHHGFGVPHRRTLDLFHRQICGEDECGKAGVKKALFHLAPQAAVITTAAGVVQMTRGTHRLLLRADAGSVTIADYEYAPSYGVKVPSRVIVLAGAETKISWTLEIE